MVFCEAFRQGAVGFTYINFFALLAQDDVDEVMALTGEISADGEFARGAMERGGGVDEGASGALGLVAGVGSGRERRARGGEGRRDE